MKTKLHDTHIYKEIAHNIAEKIESGVLKAGEKLPSIRTICREWGVSPGTSLEAYYYLEGKGMIVSRPRSGYFVHVSRKPQIAVPTMTNPGQQIDSDLTNQLVSKVYSNLHSDTEVLFSVGVPAPEFLPLAKLSKELTKAIRDLPGNGTRYELVQGNEKLRRQIALQSMHWNGHLMPEDIVITSGCMEAVSLCLMAVTRPGDSIATESPVYFGLLQVAQGLGLRVIELPTHPLTGIDPKALEKVAKAGSIAACCIIGNYNNPLGSCIPDENKKEITEFLARYQVALIEDDLYGDLFFGNRRPLSCKSFDKSGNVLWCGSISKTLAPGYRVGWVAPGKFKDKIVRQKLYNSVSSPTIMQEAIANFFESGRYENHLRKLRDTLHKNSLRLYNSLIDHLPEGTRISQPQGGFMLWVQLPEEYDTALWYDRLLEQGIRIAPGRMFTLQNQYNSCMRLSFGLLWTEKVENAVQKMGEMLKNKQLLLHL